jgi:hypothetical protein
MGFGDGSKMKLSRPGFRKSLIQDMEAVAAGRTGNNNALLNQIASLPAGVESVTSNGRLIIAIGSTFVGDSDVVGKASTMEIAIQ